MVSKNPTFARKSIMQPSTLFVLLGPTGVGKTELSLNMAKLLGAPIVSSDSRQIYKELKIGTAAPTAEQLNQVKHYFIGTQSIFDSYSAGQYEEDAINLLERLFTVNPNQLLVGGSMMYIDAVCKGFDNIPAVPEHIRKEVNEQYQHNGLEWLQQELKKADPIHFEKVDKLNHKRMLHALEVSIATGQPYSSFCTGQVKKRPFHIVKIGLNRPRPALYERINLRVDQMLEEGLIQEAEPLYPYRHLNSLNTVGYKELYQYMDGKCTLEFAIEKIKQDSRNYAKRQLTWFNADKEINWFHPEESEKILEFVQQHIR